MALVRVQSENGQLSGALAKANAKIEHMNRMFLSSAFSFSQRT